MQPPLSASLIIAGDVMQLINILLKDPAAGREKSQNPVPPFGAAPTSPA